ncbi:MAG: protein kinase [Zavarzinella sp.]
MNEETLFHLLINAPEHERQQILNRECAGQTELRHRMLELLANCQTSDGVIHQMCEFFQEGLESGIIPDVEELVATAQEEIRAELIMELIKLEERYADTDERGRIRTRYCELFPKYREMILNDDKSPRASPSMLESTVDSKNTVVDSSDKYPEIPNYVIQHELAKGGMGCVYAAYDKVFEREVAIKTLLPKANRNRFIVESRITGMLTHPSIPPVHELGTTAEGMPYLVMKLIRGKTLSELLKGRNSLEDEFPRFMQIFAQIVQAVAFAHSQGVIHRDLKPLNVMVGQFGEVQVMDWGLARKLSDSESEGRENRVNNEIQGLTIAGMVMGTPGYLSPSQARGEKANPSFDVFALGSILTSILTGKPAVTGESAREIILKTARNELQDAMLRLQFSTADQELVKIARMCLLTDLADSFPDAQAVYTAIQEYQNRLEKELKLAQAEKAVAYTRIAEARKRQRLVKSAITVLGIVILTGLFLSVRYAFQAAQAEKKAYAQEKVAAGRLKDLRNSFDALQDTQEMLDRLLAVSRMQLANAMWRTNDPPSGIGAILDTIPNRLRGWEHSILAQQLPGGYMTLSGHDRDVIDLAISSDGKHVVSAGVDRSLRVWNSDTGECVHVISGLGSAIQTVNFHPKDNIIISGSNDGTLRIWDVISGKQTRVILAHESPIFCVRWFPSGRGFATASNDGMIHLYNDQGKLLKKIHAHAKGVESIDFHPDGNTMYSIGKDDLLKIWSLNDYSHRAVSLHEGTQGYLASVGVGSSENHKFSLNHCTVCSPDGSRIASREVDKNVIIRDASNGKILLILDNESDGTPKDIQFSPDGLSVSAALSNGSIQIWNAITGQQQGILHSRHNRIYSHRYTPDGTRIIAAATSGKLVFWNITVKHQQSIVASKIKSNDQVISSPMSDRYIVINHNQNMIIRSLSDHQQIVDIPIKDRLLSQISFSPAGKYAVGYFAKDDDQNDKVVSIWNTNNGQLLKPFSDTNNTGRAIAFAGNDRYLICSHSDREIVIVDIDKEHSKPLVALESQAPGRIVAVAEQPLWLITYMYPNLRIWSIPDGKLLNEIALDKFTMAFVSNDGKSLIISQANGKLILFDLVKNRRIKEFKKSSLFISINPDTNMFAMQQLSSSHINLIDTATGNILRTIQPAIPQGKHLLFSPDGTRLFTADSEGRISVWDTEFGNLLMTLSCEQRIRNIHYHATRNSLLVYVQDGTLYEFGAIPPDAEVGPPAPQMLQFRKNMATIPRASWHYQQGILAERLNHWFSAEWHWAKLLQIEPDSQTARKKLLEAKLKRFGQPILPR